MACYFDHDNAGRTALAKLQLVGGPVLVNNDRVLLESKSFSLNNTAHSSDSHKFLVVVEDSFNSTPWQQTFEFNNDDSDDNSGAGGVLIVGPITPLIQ